MARSYLPSKVSETVASWRKDLSKVNNTNVLNSTKAVESLTDPEEYPNMFEDWQIALSLESKVVETRGAYPPAEDYINHADKTKLTLVEAFRNMHVDEEEPLENGDFDHEPAELILDEEKEKKQNGEESQEEAVVIDSEYTDGAVIVNGNEDEEQWGTKNEGTPSA